MTGSVGRSAARRRRLSGWESALVGALLLDLLVTSVLSPYFLDPATLSDAAFNFTEKGLVALALAMLILSGEIDISVAGTVAFCSVLMGLAAQQGAGIVPLCAIALGAGALCGALNGMLVSGLGIPSIVATIGTMSLYRGAAYAILGDRALGGYPPGFEFFGQGYVFWLVSFELALFGLIAVATAIAVHSTTFGRKLYAIGANPAAARLSGISVRWHRFWLFVLVGIASGAASILLTSRIGSTRPSIAQGWELDIISIAILGGVAVTGGKGSVFGVVLAAVLFGMATFGLSLLNVPGFAMSTIMGVLLIAVVVAPRLVARGLAGVRRFKGHASRES